MYKKKLLCAVLASSMVLSVTACSQKAAAPSETTAAPAAETTAAETTAAETAAAVSAEDAELEAMKKEPAYGRPIRYWMSDGCTSGPVVADKLGYYEELGLEAEGVKGTSYTEALGTNSADVAVGHIATMLVPCTNGVELTFVGGAHKACKSLYVLADSEYETTEDMKGTKISVPNGIGASDYNITARLFYADGINPLTDVELTPVETSACVAAMQNGEISGALLSDTFAYHMVEDGTLRRVRSLLDEDFQDEPCCVIAMSTKFVEENPIISGKVTEAVKKAHNWMRENPEEATKLLIEEGLNSEDYDMNVEINTSLEFGLTDELTENGLRQVAEDYIELGIITSTKDIEEVMNKAWTPIVPEN